MDRLVNSVANERRIANVEGCFRGGVKLQMKGRVLVGEGVLVKMCRKKSKPRQFFLFNDILVYGNILFNKKKYNNQRIIPLEDVSLEDLADDGEIKNGWIIKTRVKSFAVYAATPTEKTEWMQHIDRCVQDLIKKEGKVAATEHAAVWVPDSEAENCMCCYSTRFSVLQRRHHCRACGNVVCGSCSTHNLIVNGVSKRPVRVCDTCYKNSLVESAQKVTTSATVTAAPGAHPNDTSDSDEDETKVGESPRGGNVYSPPTFYGTENGSSPKTNP
uniref:Pleckstrin homology domain-containing family F member 2 n=1 Tax=Steinernema glaseri TaxID=37863 RepID=A0A1I7YSP1_9BILA